MKILVIRFSSIGDIVLTTPVIRSIKRHDPKVSIHYLTKPSFIPLLSANPYIDKLIPLEEDFSMQLSKLKQEKYDHIIDLHHNLRTLRIKWALRCPSSSFPKENFHKYLMVRGWKKNLQLDHIVDRYGRTLLPLGISLDHDGLDMFLPEENGKKAQAIFSKTGFKGKDTLAVALGGSYPTKRWLPEYFAELLNSYGAPVILLGGPDLEEECQFIRKKLHVPYFDAVGNIDLLTSAALMKQCASVLCHDSGFMHIAAAFGMKIISLWGNTVPGFGMTPYKTEHKILEVENLSCRPCSKIGYLKCPKGHFDCMRKLSPNKVLQALQHK